MGEFRLCTPNKNSSRDSSIIGVVFFKCYTSLLQPKPAVEKWVDEF